MSLAAPVMERRDVYAALTAAMLGIVPDTRFGERLHPGKLKSRLLEAHPSEASPDGVVHLLEQVTDGEGQSLTRLDDGLWVIDTSNEIYFIDTLNPRFWLLHTTASATTLDSLLSNQFLSKPALDTAWFTGAMLGEFEGERYWMKSSFIADDLDSEAPARRWRVQVEGVAPEELLEVVRQQLPRYAAATALTAVGSRVEAHGLGMALIVADYQGRFASSGDSFEAVAGVLWRSASRYEDYVRGLEQMYRLQVAPRGAGLHIDGDVAVIEFPEEVTNLRQFLAGLFDCRAPFRLWAVPREATPGEWEANAVDLHVGHFLRLEITPRWMRVLLNEQTCGNTLARLVANLQHRFHAQTVISNAAA